MTPELSALLDAALRRGVLLPASHANIHSLLADGANQVYEDTVTELAKKGEWKELDDRFYEQLRFGTGGMRGPTVSRPTDAERGSAKEGERPEHPCVGTNTVNFYNITRATLGLCRHLKAAHNAEGRPGRPSIVLARDTRHFGQAFAGRVAKVATENGCDVHRFVEPRSTPQLSFSVRHLKAGAGIVLTASHNPAHDNGFKVYWNDGAQILGDHADCIVKEVNRIHGEEYDPVPENERGRIFDLGPELDEIYLARLESLLLDPELVKAQRDSLRIVFTNLHGTGGVIAPALLRRLGFRCDTVADEDPQDGSFGKLKSPNPENDEALAAGIAQAERDGADIVIGTDPDCDRMGVAVRDDAGALKTITGNQIGSLLAWYRIRTLIRQGIVTEENRSHSVLVKTFVTTELQAAIAAKHGIPCVNTLTGFKYIGAKLAKYEHEIPKELRENYRDLSDTETRALRLRYSKFFIFGGEESYGYLGADFLRDKDGNGAVAMFAELAAYARSEGVTIFALLDRLYCEYGYHREGQYSKTLPGSDGNIKIKALAADYSARPPEEMSGSKAIRQRDFSKGGLIDEETDPIPRENMLFVELADGRAFAVRPSGTEPKIKFYFFLRPKPGTDPAISPEKLAEAKAAGDRAYEALKQAVIADLESRLADLK